MLIKYCAIYSQIESHSPQVTYFSISNNTQFVYLSTQFRYLLPVLDIVPYTLPHLLQSPTSHYLYIPCRGTRGIGRSCLWCHLLRQFTSPSPLLRVGSSVPSNYQVFLTSSICGQHFRLYNYFVRVSATAFYSKTRAIFTPNPHQIFL